ncbi:MAG: hypothetical protein OXC26_12785 [Albidovulum sp.]|nr:hypothetical protein [Albidovulum sp.]
MKNIEIDRATFERLQRHAKPFVDTPDIIINRALDALEFSEGHPGSSQNAKTVEREIDPQALPDLKHTKILDASVAGQGIVKPNWNRLLEGLLILGMEQLGDFDRLWRMCPANIVKGRKVNEGYRYLSEVDISFQGMSANDACSALVSVACSLKIGIKITFMWRRKEGAQYPGERAQLSLSDQSMAS